MIDSRKMLSKLWQRWRAESLWVIKVPYSIRVGWVAGWVKVGVSQVVREFNTQGISEIESVPID